ILDHLAAPATWTSLLGYCRSRGGLNDNFLARLRSFRHLRHPSRRPQRLPPVFDRLWRISWPNLPTLKRIRPATVWGLTMWFALVAGTKHWLSEDRNELYQTCLLPALFNVSLPAVHRHVGHVAHQLRERFLCNNLDPAILWPLGRPDRALASPDLTLKISRRRWMLRPIIRLQHRLGTACCSPCSAPAAAVRQPPFADSESIRSSRRACLCHCLDCLGDSAAKAFLAALNESPVESAAFKTLIWALANHLSVLRKPLPRLVCGSIGPLCRALQSVKTDDDKIKSCLQHLPAVLVLAKDSGLLAESLSAALSDTTRWQGRRAALNLLQGLAYHNAFQLDPGKLRALVLDRLSDPTVEVRECASQALGGLMGLRTMGRMTQSKDPVVKHAGVLGLCAARLRARPYTVPDHLPELVARLCQAVSVSSSVKSY
uniref:DUF3437 domain-containing protein n=1 Tax=Macrostomum lignano TaxID=282301 RepID=A0A1I8JNK8_9PLAT